MDRLVVLDPVYVLHLRTTAPTATCPLCGGLSQRVHSRYQRSLTDVPWAGKTVRILLQIRRFFCPTRGCRRKTFTERVESIVKSYARTTTRFTQALVHIGLAAGGKAGARLARQLGYPTSADTLLRRLRQIALPATPTPRVLGIDDFALKKGQTYGTLLVDLERQQPIDVLPDREVATVRDWLAAHPGIQIISRDRAGAYAEAARKAAPHATQVADRFHVHKNLSDVVLRVLQGHIKRIHEILGEGQAHDARQPDRPARKAAQLSRYRQRVALYEEVMARAAQGMPRSTIAQELDISVRRVRLFLKGPPYMVQHPPSATILDPYRAYLRKQFARGDRTGIQLFEEIRAQGYSGGKSAVVDYLTALRRQPAPTTPEDEPTTVNALPFRDYRYAPHHLMWWFTLLPERLGTRQRAKRAQLCAAIPDLETTYTLVQGFRHLFVDHDAAGFTRWADAMEASGVPELMRFAKGLRRDAAAIEAAITTRWSNGPVEGEVNKVKFLKRSMFGRAKFDLLRLRIRADEAPPKRFDRRA